MSVVQFYPLPCVVSLVVKTGDCESPYEGSNPSRHPNEKSSNGRTPPFEGVYLGSSPSFSASPIDGIGIHTCLRNKVLQVRVLYRAPCPFSSVDYRAVGYEPMCREFESLKGRLTNFQKFVSI